MKQLELQTDHVLAQVENGLGWITFNQPGKRNAVSLDMWQEIPRLVSALAEDEDVSVVVMKGAGDKAFVSGSDISEFDKKRSTSEQVKVYNDAAHDAYCALKGLEKPLIAMIRGYCIGGGLGIALCADLRITANDGQFGIPAGRLGLGYSYGGVMDLVNVVGPSYAKEIFFTGGRLNAREAKEIGLVNRVLPVDELEQATQELAELIARNAPLTVKAAKAAINEGMKDLETRDMAKVDQMVAACFASEDYIEGRRAFMEKRRPHFRGR